MKQSTINTQGGFISVGDRGQWVINIDKLSTVIFWGLVLYGLGWLGVWIWPFFDSSVIPMTVEALNGLGAVLSRIVEIATPHWPFDLIGPVWVLGLLGYVIGAGWMGALAMGMETDGKTPFWTALRESLPSVIYWPFHFLAAIPHAPQILMLLFTSLAWIVIHYLVLDMIPFVFPTDHEWVAPLVAAVPDIEVWAYLATLPILLWAGPFHYGRSFSTDPRWHAAGPWTVAFIRGMSPVLVLSPILVPLWIIRGVTRFIYQLVTGTLVAVYRLVTGTLVAAWQKPAQALARMKRRRENRRMRSAMEEIAEQYRQDQAEQARKDQAEQARKERVEQEFWDEIKAETPQYVEPPQKTGGEVVEIYSGASETLDMKLKRFRAIIESAQRVAPKAREIDRDK